VDGRPLAPRIVAARESVQVELEGEGWHALLVRAAPGLRLVRAAMGDAE